MYDLQIFKVQLALAQSGDGPRRVLLYNEARDIVYETEATPELLSLMRGRAKVYFTGYLDKEHMINLGEEVDPPSW